MIFPPVLGQFGLLKHDSGLADGQATIARRHAQIALHHRPLMMQELNGSDLIPLYRKRLMMENKASGGSRDVNHKT